MSEWMRLPTEIRVSHYVEGIECYVDLMGGCQIDMCMTNISIPNALRRLANEIDRVQNQEILHHQKAT